MGNAAGYLIGGLLVLAVVVLLIAAQWRIFTKAGQPGWAAIVPIYSTITLLRVVGRPWWWILLWIIPLAGPFIAIVHGIMISLDLAKSFGKGTGFGVCTIFFSYVTIPILGFGDAVYRGPAAAQPMYPGQPYPGQPYPGQPYPGQAYPGQPYAGQPYPQQQYPPQPYPPQAYPGQQYPGQQYPGQQYPGQQYPPR